MVEHSLREQIARYAITSFYEVETEDPRLQPMLTPFAQELLDGEHAVGAATLAAETVFMVEILLHRA